MNFLLSFAVIRVLFAMIFKVLPHTEVAWGDVWIGAGVTALLFTIGKMLIGLYPCPGSVSGCKGMSKTPLPGKMTIGPREEYGVETSKVIGWQEGEAEWTVILTFGSSSLLQRLP